MSDVHQPSPFPNQRNLKHQPLHLSNLSSSKSLHQITTNFHLKVTTNFHYKASRTTLLSLCLTSQPLDVPASSTPAIPISIQERPRVRRRSEPFTQRLCHSPMEDDRLSVSSLKSTDSTRTTDSVRDREDYLKQSERLFILQSFTVGALKNMRNYEGQTPAGDRKTDVLARAVQLVKTKTEIVDFILAACPYK
ncbi:hypothetical protein TVAGG3_0627960 [Trichomonas vaginalis G3]|uniref:hypothetical protein n=1 Tax=Trichomonas vaginalis (strain ATCC PRA-98 / G3) TaxID=412133 RepID=UPI0021E61245|nr:hypothetical protein TVAGG3_0627960 [Trichomonas vaginalis G3]KAI5504318.1 hypothetical protein TVAGG3_0627960 [Trichomonas vaginalis G3]